MFHPESRRMIENHPTDQCRGIRRNKHIERAPPSHIRRVLYKSTGNSWTKGSRDAENVAEAVTKQTVLHGDQLAHDVVVGELRGGADADEGHATDEGWDGLRGGTDDAAEGGADCAGDKDVAALVSEVIREMGRTRKECEGVTYRRPKMSDTRPIINSVMALANVYTSDTHM
jgi:hypothetical protein